MGVSGRVNVNHGLLSPPNNSVSEYSCVSWVCLMFCGADSHWDNSGPLSPNPSLCYSARKWDILTISHIYPMATISRDFWPIITSQPNLCPHIHMHAKHINTIKTNTLWNSTCSICNALYFPLFSIIIESISFFKCQQQSTKLISGPISGLWPVPRDIKSLHLNADITRSTVPISHYHPPTPCCASAHYSHNKCVLSICSMQGPYAGNQERYKHKEAPIPYL